MGRLHAYLCLVRLTPLRCDYLCVFVCLVSVCVCVRARGSLDTPEV
jgi:hypothetical protein